MLTVIYTISQVTYQPNLIHYQQMHSYIIKSTLY